MHTDNDSHPVLSYGTKKPEPLWSRVLVVATIVAGILLICLIVMTSLA